MQFSTPLPFRTGAARRQALVPAHGTPLAVPVDTRQLGREGPKAPPPPSRRCGRRSSTVGAGRNGGAAKPTAWEPANAVAASQNRPTAPRQRDKSLAVAGAAAADGAATALPPLRPAL